MNTVSGEATFLGMADVSEAGEIVGGSIVNVAEKGHGYTRFQTDDVLVAKITPCFENGKGAIATRLQNGIGLGSTEFHVLRASASVQPQFLHLITRTHRFRLSGESNMSGSAGQKRVPAEFLRSYAFHLPPLAEQLEISRMLSTWDTTIGKAERLIDAKTSLLYTRRESLIARKNDVARVKLSAATHESTARNGTRMGRDAIMAVTKSEGLRPMREETISASIDRYKIVKPSSFAYNPMRINIGSIAMSSFKHDVLVSPDYVVFECDPAKLIPGYLSHLRRTSLWSQFFDTAGSGGVRIRIYYADLAAFTFPLPSVAEQARVVTQLDLAALEIETLTRYVAALKTQKRGLMQKLLTGQWRVPLSVSEASEVRA